MTIQCCVCGKIREDGKWHQKRERNSQEAISHTYCPVCLNEAITGMNSERRYEYGGPDAVAVAV